MGQQSNRPAPIQATMVPGRCTTSATVVVVAVFGEDVTLTWEGRGHHTRAAEWCQQFNQRMDAEWQAVRAAPAAMMEHFCGRLAKAGVPQHVITRAARAAVAEGASDGGS